MKILIFQRYFSSMRLAALTLCVSCADFQIDGVQIDSPAYQSEQTIAEGSCSSSFEPSLANINSILDVYSLIYDHPDHAPKLHALHNKQIAKFWQFRYSQAQKNQKDVTKLADSLENEKQDISSEMELLSELFRDPMPARARTLLYILGDILISLSDRLAANVVFYDFACQLNDCHQNSHKSEFKDLVNLIAALPDREKLNVLLRDTKGALRLRSEWRAIFVSIADPIRHGLLEEAVLIATRQTVYSPDLMYLAVDVPDSMKMLSSVLLRCQRWAYNLEYLGYFEYDSRPTLDVSLNHERIADWSKELRRQLDDLNTVYSQLAMYRQRETDYYRNQSATGTKLKQIQFNIEKHISQLGVLQAEITDREIGRTFAKDIGALTDEGSEVQVGSIMHASVSSDHAQKGIPGDVSSWALPEQVLKPLFVERGHILTLMVQGTWSPTCALRTTRPDAATTLVGSEGFDEQLIRGQVQAVSLSTYPKSGGAFARVGGGRMGSQLGGRFGARSSGTKGTSTTNWSQRESDDINSTEMRLATSFSAGLRLPNTPFPDFPVGSLLMVIQSAAQEQEITVEVVRPQINFVAPYSGHLWFVVNDSVDTDCKATNIGHHLDLHVRVAKPMSSAGTQLGEAMAVVTTELNERLLATIELQPTLFTTSLIRSDIVDNLNRRGILFENLPPALSNLFQAFLDKALASFERKLRVIDRERDLQALRLEEAALEQDLAMNKSERRLNDLAQTWTANDAVLDNPLHWRTLSLLDFASESLIPAFGLLYPERIAAMRQSMQPMAKHLAILSDFPFMHDFTSLLLSVKEIISDLEDDLRLIRSIASPPGRTGIALTFVRPGRSTFFRSPQVDSARAKALWNAIDYGRKVTVAVRPEDVYRPNFNHSESLRCGYCTPILRFMGVYFVVPPGIADPRQVNSQSYTIATNVYSDLLFATPYSASSYNAIEKWPTLPIKIGEDAQVRSTSVWGEGSRYAMNGAAGFSPFARYTFDFSRSLSDSSVLSHVIEESTAFVIVMDVETQRCKESSLKWLEACR